MPSARKEDFLVLETIGKGNFGTCQRIMRKADKKVRASAVFRRLFWSAPHFVLILCLLCLS
jgi:hypothetical protein